MGKLEDRIGRCYELSGNFQVDNQEYTLVHGFITDRIGDTGHTIDHAWVEKDGEVYDPVLDKSYPTDIYEALTGAEEIIRYEYIKTLNNIQKTGHWGPWHEVDQSRIVFDYEKYGKVK